MIGAEEFFCECVASAELHLFGEDAQRCFGGNEVNFGDARVGVEGAQHLGGKDRAAGAGDGQGEPDAGDNAVAGGYGFGWTSHQSDYRPSCGSQCLNSNDLALEREQERGKLAFDDAGRARDSRMGQRGRLAGVHAEEGKDSLADAVRQQDARSPPLSWMQRTRSAAGQASLLQDLNQLQ